MRDGNRSVTVTGKAPFTFLEANPFLSLRPVHLLCCKNSLREQKKHRNFKYHICIISLFSTLLSQAYRKQK